MPSVVPNSLNIARPLRAEIHLGALRHNLRQIRMRAGSRFVWAVVKADAYGHGVLGLLPTLAAADGLALIELEAAINIRSNGWTKPILLLEGFYGLEDLRLCAELDFTVAVHCDDQIALLRQAHISKPVSIALKLNTGMNRLGFPAEHASARFNELRGLTTVKRVDLMTHFARSDEPGGTLEQAARFHVATSGLNASRALANSAALWDTALEPQGDAVRPGIVLYGATPASHGSHSAASMGLLPVMHLRTRIIGVQSLQAGDPVGYGALFVAPTAMRLGIVACGYADGYPRAAPTGTPIIVNGIRTRIVGRVSMDKIAVDLTPCPHAGVGSEVELWGARLPVDEVAEHAKTIGYELLTAVTARVPRVVVED